MYITSSLISNADSVVVPETLSLNVLASVPIVIYSSSFPPETLVLDKVK
jgi:hypothetical protein